MTPKFGKHFHRDKEIYSRRPRQGNQTRSRENRQGGRIAAGGRRATAKRAPPELGAARGMPGRGRPHSREGADRTQGMGPGVSSTPQSMTNDFSSTERSSMSRRGGTDLLSVSRLWMGVCTQGSGVGRRGRSDFKGNDAPGRMHGEHGGRRTVYLRSTVRVPGYAWEGSHNKRPRGLQRTSRDRAGNGRWGQNRSPGSRRGQVLQS